jgi:hypothetical protein
MLRTLSLFLATTAALFTLPACARQPMPAPEPALTLATAAYPPGNRWDAIQLYVKQITAHAATIVPDTTHRTDPGDEGEEETAEQAPLLPVALGPPGPGSAGLLLIDRSLLCSA